MSLTCSPEFTSHALGLVAERRRLEGEDESVWSSCQAVATALGGISLTPCTRGTRGINATVLTRDRPLVLPLGSVESDGSCGVRIVSCGVVTRSSRPLRPFFAAEPGRSGPR